MKIFIIDHIIMVRNNIATFFVLIILNSCNLKSDSQIENNDYYLYFTGDFTDYIEISVNSFPIDTIKVNSYYEKGVPLKLNLNSSIYGKKMSVDMNFLFTDTVITLGLNKDSNYILVNLLRPLPIDTNMSKYAHVVFDGVNKDGLPIPKTIYTPVIKNRLNSYTCSYFTRPLNIDDIERTKRIFKVMP